MAVMKVLVIGGGQFVGRHFLQAALARGHQVTAFNRGLTAPQPLAGVTHLQGDRKGDLSALHAGRWDAVVDTCGYLPRDVARTADALRGRVERYLFVSSVSVYADFATPNHEDSPLGTIDDVDTDVVDARTYGPLKALCERSLLQGFNSASTLIVRPGLVVGPHDATQRFTYWPARIGRADDGEAVLVPGAPQHPIQCIDARDLAAFMLDCIEAGRTGRFNAASPSAQWTMGELLATCARVAKCAPQWRWADAAVLASLGLKPWNDMPLWLEPQGEYAAFAHTDVSAALAAGLHIRPLADTVADTLTWYRSLPTEAQAFTKAGLSPEREAAALAAMM
jgi:2'-hydroxyisoflavone reductase